MSLVKCIDCGKDVSEYADRCPNCGCPIDIIKENQNREKSTKIVFRTGKEVDITGIETKYPEVELKNKNEFWDFLMSEYGLGMGDSCVINGIIEFNNYRYPENFQETYEQMRARNRERVNRNLITCPNCKSSDVEKISFAKKAVSIGGLGILSNKIGKTYQCKKCKYTW